MMSIKQVCFWGLGVAALAVLHVSLAAVGGLTLVYVYCMESLK